MTTWFILSAAVALFLVVDFFVFGRAGVTFRGAAAWSIGWLALGVGFTAVMWAWRGGEPAGEYLSGYLIERSLSIDNVFVFAVIFAAFAVPSARQGPLLSLGIVIALVLRVGFILAGAALLDAFHLTIYVFGAVLLLTGVKLARQHGASVHPDRNVVLRLVRRVRPAAGVTTAAVVTIATTDIIFAIDSIPAIFAVTDDAFIVFAANAFALLGLRSLYFLLAGMMDRFELLTYGLAGVLGFVGLKMLLTDIWKIPVWASLLVIVITIVASIVASLVHTADERPTSRTAHT